MKIGIELEYEDFEVVDSEETYELVDDEFNKNLEDEIGCDTPFRDDLIYLARGLWKVDYTRRDSHSEMMKHRKATALVGLTYDTIYLEEAKEDGTLRNGIELVSVVLKSLDDVFSYWDEVDGVINDYGLKAKATCGMHVHVDKDELTAAQWYRLYRFINHPKNARFVKAIAGRYNNKYAKVATEKRWNHAARFRSLYGVTPHGTYEFRLFSSSTKEETVMKRVLFVVAMVEVAKETNKVSVKKVVDKMNTVVEKYNASIY